MLDICFCNLFNVKKLELKAQLFKRGVLEKGLRTTVLDIAMIKFVDESSREALITSLYCTCEL